jgi:hypothetical protein
LWYSEGMTENPTLPEAIGAFIETAYASRHYTGAHGYNHTMNIQCDEQTLTLKKWQNYMEDFEHDLGRIQEQFADLGITLNPIANEAETVKRSRFHQFLSLKADPEKPDVSFSIACENPATAIAALTQKTGEMKEIALENRAAQIIHSAAASIPKNMPPELARKVANGLGDLAIETAKKHKVPLYTIEHGLHHEATIDECKSPSFVLD